MMFCKKCGAIMMPKKGKMVCTSCGHSEKGKSSFKEKVEQQKEVDIIDREENESLPKIEVECPKCKNNEAYYWLVQTRAGDEAETKFYKCTKCKHTWREYD